MHPVLVALLFGAAPALFLASIGGASVKRRHVAQVESARRAIAEESAILKTLDPDSPAAAELGAILQTRLDVYTGRRVVRPKLRTHLLMALTCSVMATWAALGLRQPTSDADQFVKGIFCGFFVTIVVLDGLGLLKVMGTYRAQLKRAQAIQGQAEAPAAESAPESSETV